MASTEDEKTAAAAGAHVDSAASTNVHKRVNDEENVDFVARTGQAATDLYGNPLVEFDPVAVRKLRRKVDWCTIPTVALLYLFCFIDRANIGNARLAGLEEDLKLQGFDYNQVLSIFYISYIIFEIPSTVCCKWMGPGWFLPTTSLLFGIVSIATAFVHSKEAICGVRFLLGIFEAGMLPGIAYYLSRWYQRAELTFRLSLYMVMAPLAGAFGGLLASAILTLDHFGGLHAWRMIFAIEGIITIGLSLLAFFTLTDRPETARWLTMEEKSLCIARVKAERVGATEVLDGINLKKLLRGLSNPVAIMIACCFLFNNIIVQGLAFFLPTLVASLYPEKSVVDKQLLSVPPYIVGAVFTVGFPALSWRLDRRQLLIALSAPLSMIGYIMFLASKDNNVRYGATFFITSSAMVMGPMSNAHISANVVSDMARSSAIGLNVMAGNIGGLVATWSYIAYDAPDYHIGNGLNLAAASSMFVIATAGWFWMKASNKRRERRDVAAELEGKSAEEIADLDWKHPAFRWRT